MFDLALLTNGLIDNQQTAATTPSEAAPRLLAAPALAAPHWKQLQAAQAPV